MDPRGVENGESGLEAFEAAMAAGREARRKGRAAEAEPLLLRSLAIRERVAPSHPSEISNLAWSLNGLADFYVRQRRYKEAEPLYQRAVAVREQAQGPDHPWLVGIFAGYADLLDATRRPDEAARLRARSRDILARHGSPEWWRPGKGSG